MKILSTYQETSLERVQPEGGFGDVGEGGIVEGLGGAPFSGDPTDGTFPYYDATTGEIDWLTILGFFGTVISPPQLTADTDDWAPTGLATSAVLRVDLDAAHNLTGIVAPAATGQRTIVLLANVSAFTLTLKHDATSTAANRFYCPNDADLTLSKDSAVILEYDLTSARWRVVGGTGGGGDVLVPHGSMGATETLDYIDGDVHTGTLDDDTALSFVGAVAGTPAAFSFELTEDGSGGHTPLWPGTVVWVGGVTPDHDGTAGSVELYVFLSVDGGSTWDGAKVGAGGSITVKDEGTPLASSATSLDFVGAGVVASGTGHGKTITIPGTPSGSAGGSLAGTFPNPSVTEAGVYGVGGHWEVLMDPATSSPPVPLTTPDGTDWVYGWVSDGG